MIRTIEYTPDDKEWLPMVGFKELLRPAGFLVHMAEKLDRRGPGTYILKVERLSPEVHSEGNPGGNSPPAHSC